MFIKLLEQIQSTKKSAKVASETHDITKNASINTELIDLNLDQYKDTLRDT